MSDACGRESGHGFRQSAAAAVRGALLPRLALCAAAAAAAAAQTAPVYRMDTIAGDLSASLSGQGLSESRACRTDFDGHRLPGDGGPASQALLCGYDYFFRTMTMDGAGNIFFVDAGRVRRIDAATGIIDTVVGKGTFDLFYEGVNSYRNRNSGWYYGGQAIDASPRGIRTIAADSAGNLFIAVGPQRIDRVDAATGIISAFAGTGEGSAGYYSGDGGPAIEAEIGVNSMALDGAGNLFFADYSNAVIRRIDAATGIINTVAGGGTDRKGEGIPALEASLKAEESGPQDIAVDGAGNLFIADGYTRIRKIDTATGLITTVAGKDNFRRSGPLSAPELFGIGDGGPAVEASFIRIQFIALDGAGNLFISDDGNDSLRRVDAATGIVDTIAGIAGDGSSVVPYSQYADGLLGLEFNFYGPSPVADRDGNIFVFHYGAYGSSTIGRLTPWTGGGAPAIAEGGVVLAAGTPLVERISPNALISVFGQDFAAPGEPAIAAALDASGRVPVNLANTCLEIRRTHIQEEGTFSLPLPRGFGDQRVPLFLVSPTQINAQAPHDLTPGEAAVLTVVQGCGTADELRNPLVETWGTIVPPSLKVAAVSPAFFNVVNNANGRNPLVAQHGGGPALVGPPELGAAFTPAAPGEIVTLYGTGFGPTEPALEAGVVPGVPADLAYPVSFRVGGKAVPPQDVLYAGAAPCCAGLHQFTLRLPADLPDGDAALTATVLGVFTPQGPFLAIRRR